MKILICSLWPISISSIGGTERYVVDLATALYSRGIDVDVLMISGEETVINGVNYFPIKVKDGGKVDEFIIKSIFFNTFNLKNLNKFAQFIESQFDKAKYDIVHCNSLLFWNLFPGKKKIFTLHENNLEFEKNWGLGSLGIVKETIKQNNSLVKFVAPSRYYAQIFTDLFSCKVEIIPHSIDTNRLTNSINKNDILDQYGLKSNKLTIVIPSRLDLEQKGQDIGLESLGLLKDKTKIDFQVVLTGVDNQHKSNIKKLREITCKFKLDAYFISFEKMSEAYAIADIVLLPSRFESFGYSALESLSLKKKVVLSNIPSYAEISQDNPNAYLVKLDPKDFSFVIEKAISSGIFDLKKEWIERYSLPTWIQNYINLYESF